jgi:hypothetical protein
MVIKKLMRFYRVTYPPFDIGEDKMKKIIKYAGIILVSLFLASCATTPLKVVDKYNFDNELKEITDINSFRIDSWESIDNQSLILKTNLNNDYYLIILQRPALNLPYAERVGITDSGIKITTGFDKIVVADSNGSESYIIHKMYKLDNREQAKEIKKKLRKSP